VRGPGGMDRQGEASLRMVVGALAWKRLRRPSSATGDVAAALGGVRHGAGVASRRPNANRAPARGSRTSHPYEAAARTPGLLRDGTHPSLLSPSGEAILAPHL